MTEAFEQAKREFADKWRRMTHSYSPDAYTREFLSDLTALISEHYVAKEEVDKMVSERLREELIKYDKYASRWIDNYRAETAEDCVDEYLKSKEQ